MSIKGLQFVTGTEDDQYLGGNIAEGDSRTYASAVWDYLISNAHGAGCCTSKSANVEYIG